MFFFILDNNNRGYPYQSFIQILILNPLNHPLSLVKGLIGYAQQEISLNDLQTTNYRINEHREFMDAYISNYFTYGSSDTLKYFYWLNLSEQQERECKSQQKRFHIPFDVSHFTESDRNFLTMFNFEHTKLTQTQFEQLEHSFSHNLNNAMTRLNSV